MSFTSSNYVNFHKHFLVVAAALVAVTMLVPTLAQAQAGSGPFLTVSAADDQLRTVDPASGATVNTVTITSTGNTVTGGVGLARNPLTGELFALLRMAGFTGSVLVSLNSTTGVATTKGDTGDDFIAIAYTSEASFFGMTSDAATVASTLYTMSETDGTSTLQVALPNGTTGDAMTIGDNGLVYHASGTGVQNDAMAGEILETVDRGTLAIVPVTLSVGNYDQILAMTIFSEMFLFSDTDISGTGADQDLYLVRQTGEIQYLSTLDHAANGLAFGGAAASCIDLADLFGAAHRGNATSVLYVIDPATGAATTVGPIGFDRVSAMAFDNSARLFGTGTNLAGAVVVIEIDPCTGLGTEVGASVFAQGASVENGTDVFFAVSNDNLQTIDTGAGTATAVGMGITSGVLESGYGMAFDAADTLFTVIAVWKVCDGGSLYTVNTTTGVGTAVATMGFVAPAVFCPRINAMDFEPTSDVLFASVNDGGGGGGGSGGSLVFENHLGTVNTTSGAVTIIGPTVDGLDALAFRTKTDMSITKTASPEPVAALTDLTYTITITNNGPIDAASVRLDDTLPVGPAFVSAVPSQGTCNPPNAGVVTCELGGIINGAFATVTIIVTPNVDGNISNSATVTIPGGDANPLNNTATASSTVTAYTLSVAPTSIIIKKNSSGTVTVSVTPPVGSAFSGAVALSCGAVPVGVTCSLNPASVTPGGSAATSTLTITHAKKVGMFIPVFDPTSFNLFLLGLFGLMAASLLIFTRRNAHARRFAPAVILLAGVMLLSACGAKRVVYDVIITGTSGSISKTTTLNVATK